MSQPESLRNILILFIVIVAFLGVAAFSKLYAGALAGSVFS
jgi:hypothetical protein